jgi:hypothetical protein
MTDAQLTNTHVTNTHAAAPTDPQALATATAHAMWQRDRTAQALAMRIEHVAPGHATLSMPVRSDMVNGHHICHGGMIFTLSSRRPKKVRYYKQKQVSARPAAVPVYTTSRCVLRKAN